MDACKALGTVAKRHGELLFPGFWMALVDWNLSFGATPNGEEDFSEQLEAWVHTEKEEDRPGSARRVMVEDGLAALKRKQMLLPPQLGFEEFLRRPSLWLVNGSTTGKRLRGSRATKFSTFLASSNTEMKAALYDGSQVDYVVLEKREKGKLRNLVTSPWSMHVQMSWLAQGAEDALETVFPTTLSNRITKMARWKTWRQMMVSRIGVPIDQSTFDHVPWMDLMIEVCEWVIAQGRAQSPEPGRHDEVGTILLRRLRSARVHWNGHTWAHIRGLLSGWRWTSILGTIINYVEFLGVVFALGRPEPPPETFCLQGDDLLAFVGSWAEAYAMVKVYMDTLPVNPKKFFVDANRTEFLRYVLTPESRAGYLARAVPSILHANAWAGGKLSARAMAEQWSQVVGRGADLARARSHMVADICGMTRCQAQDVLDLLRTPKSVGGLGLELERAYAEPVRWMTLEEQSYDGAAWERRRVAKTQIELVPKDVQQHAAATMADRGGLFADAQVAAGAAESMLEAVEGQGWNAASQERTKVVSTEVIYVDMAVADTRKIQRPTLLIDPMFVRAVVVKLLPGGWTAVQRVIAEHDRLWVFLLWRAWSRNVWIDWIANSARPVAHNAWGLAPEVQSAMVEVLEEEGLFTWGKVTRLKLVQRSLLFEMRSRTLYRDEKVWIGC
uniref:RdRp n=1 Tax=viral metagenome TaxID=1070528 RepID=A0A2V0RB29_9ZZZZ